MSTTPTSGPTGTPRTAPRSFAESAQLISDEVTSQALGFSARLQEAIKVDPKLEALSDDLMKFVAETHAKTAGMRDGLEAIGIQNVEQRLEQAATNSAVYLKDRAYAPLRRAHRNIQEALNNDDMEGVAHADRVKMATTMTGNDVDEWIFSDDAKAMIPGLSEEALDIILRSKNAQECLTSAEALGREIAQKFDETGTTPAAFNPAQVIDQVAVALSDTWAVLHLMGENAINVPKDAVNAVMGHMLSDAEMDSVFADHKAIAALPAIAAAPTGCRMKIVVAGHPKAIEAYGVTDAIAQLDAVCTDGKHVVNIEVKLDDEVAALAKSMGRGVQLRSADGSVVVEATDTDEVVVKNPAGVTSQEFLAAPLRYLPVYFLVDETAATAGTPAPTGTPAP